MQHGYVFVLQILTGMLITNGVPHWVMGLAGSPFQSPFAKPPGIGESSPTVNVYWGLANLVGGFLLLAHFFPTGSVGWAFVLAGSLLMGTHCARHFGRVRARAMPSEPQ
jgi:hypothetical protein